MDSLTCEQVRHLFSAAPNNDENPSVMEASAAHVATCSRCQGTLALFAAAIKVPPPAQPSSYETCEADLAAYIERETVDGVVVAAQAFPHVWWALWTDPECTDVYLGMRALYDATASGELASFPLEPLSFTPIQLPAPRRTSLLTVPRVLLASALPTQTTRYGAWRGRHDDPMVLLDEEEADDYSVSLTVLEHPNERWAVSVRVAPSIDGALLLTIGDVTFDAPFDATGQAVLVGIPGSLLAASTGPDLELSIEHLS